MKIVNCSARRATLRVAGRAQWREALLRKAGMLRRAALVPVLLLACLAAACSTTVNQRGEILDQDAISQIKPGVTTRDDLTKTLGSPSTVASFDPNVWYYIGARTEQTAFFDPETVDQKVVMITFDATGTVKDVQTRSKDDGRDIAMIPRTTPATGREFSFIEQLLGNFGKFDPDNQKSR
ncbi:MAG TPA: outer membrane protein assembly factor BamE [Stellaceae bacterium]|nr:outer membrane protein assembly factor BamE [Stellaceae bacterium]